MAKSLVGTGTEFLRRSANILLIYGGWSTQIFYKALVVKKYAHALDLKLMSTKNIICIIPQVAMLIFLILVTHNLNYLFVVFLSALIFHLLFY